MGIGASIALFVGVPIAVIVAAGFLLNRFREPIFQSASSLGEVLGQTITRPVSGFISGVSTQLGNLPDIDLRIPGINLSLGQGTIFQEGPGPSSLAGKEVEFGDGQLKIPQGCTVLPSGQVSCPTPPTFERDDPPPREQAPPPPPPPVPEAEAASLTLLGGSLPIEIAGEITRLSRQDIITLQPNAVGLFDILGTPKTEFLPLSTEAVGFFQDAGQRLRLSGQLFQEIKGINDVV